MPISWTKDEEKQLIKEIKEKKTFPELSKIHNRSVSALMLRYNKIIYDNIEAGKDKSKLSKLLGISVEKITQAYYEHKAFIEKKNIIKNEDESKPENKSESKSDKKTSTKSSEKGQNKQKSLETKLSLLQKENKVMREYIENLKQKKNLGKLIKDEAIYKELMKIIKKYIK